MAEFKLDYTPRECFVPFHQRDQRWAALVCHRRAGKTVACIYELVIRAIYTNKKDARYAYIAPFYKQAKDVAWQYLKAATKGLSIEERESDLRVILPNGQWITLYGADNPDALRGIYLDGVVLDEFGDCRPSLWAEVILPTLVDRKGWAVFIGTPKGKNHFYEVVQRAIQKATWYDMTLKASDSGLIDAEELIEIKGMVDDAQYEQEFEVSFTAAVKGTYYAALIHQLEAEGMIGPQPDLYDPMLPVQAVMDLGRTDSTAVWFWQEPEDTDEIVVFDYVEMKGEIIEDHIKMFHSKGHKLEKLWVPHDAKAKTVQTRRSSIEQFRDAGFNVSLVPNIARQQGIDAVRMMLPACRIDNKKCYLGVEALRAYRREYNELTKTYRDTPLHNWASDGSDSFRYLSLVARQKRGTLSKPKPVILQSEPVAYTLSELYESRDEGNVLSLSRGRIR
jgi:phage terminase large subunit